MFELVLSIKIRRICTLTEETFQLETCVHQNLLLLYRGLEAVQLGEEAGERHLFLDHSMGVDGVEITTWWLAL